LEFVGVGVLLGEARLDLEPKSIRVLAKYWLRGLHEINDDAEEKADVTWRDEQGCRSGEAVLAVGREGE
ncbi:hypothetical protein B296_00052628, partial [Ensete ventricosum]